jgi:hypothetical protein
VLLLQLAGLQPGNSNRVKPFRHMTAPNSPPSLTLTNAFLYIAGIYIATVVVLDIIGVAAVFLAEVFLNRGKSEALFYAIWLVAAVFNGLFFISFAYKKAIQNKTIAARNWLVPLTSLVLTIIALFIFQRSGQLQPAAYASYNHWVPGHRGLTLTYFITFTLSAFFFHNMENWKEKQYGKKKSE